MGKLKNISYRISSAVGLDRMSDGYRTLTWIYLFLIIFTTIESVFMNTLLYRISNDMTYVVIYRGITYISSAISMAIAAVVSHRANPVFVLRLGSFFYLVAFSILFVGMDYLEQLRFIIPIFAGMGGAFYWSGHNSSVLSYTTKKNRDIGIGIFGIIQGIMTLIIPVVTGFVISLMPGNWGYRVMFGIGMVFVVIQFIFATRLSPVQRRQQSKPNFKLAFKLIKENVSFRYMLGFEAIRGMRDGLFSFLLNMLLFEIITDEKLTGINTFLTGIMAIIGSWVYGKYVYPHLRGKVVSFSSTILLVFTSLLLLKMNIATLMIFTTVNAFFQLFLLNSYNNTSYDITVQNEDATKTNREMYGLREFAIGGGRVLGLSAYLLMPRSQLGAIIIMAVLTVIQYWGAHLVKKASIIVEEEHLTLEEA